MKSRQPIPLERLEERVTSRARRARRLFYLLLVISAVLFIINASVQRGDREYASLAQQWWSLIPILGLAGLGVFIAARDLWLRPDRLTLRRWLQATRTLHEPLFEVRSAADRMRNLLGDLPGKRPEHQAVLDRGQSRLDSIVEAPLEDDGARDMERRLARIDAYRIALNTVEIDALIKKDFVGSSVSRRALEGAVALLEDDRDEVSTTEFPSVAVLPFADLSPLGDQEHFSQGLAEELIHALARIQGLKVIARGLSFSLAEQNLSLREIGRRLGVDAVLEGNVQRSADRLSVSTQLIGVANGHELWSGHFDEAIEGVFRIETEMVNGVVGALDVRPSSEEQQAIDKPPTGNVAAYDLYLRGRRYFSQYHGRGMEFALEMFSRAIELDEGYALAWAGIADCCAFLYANSGRSPEYRDRALEASARALELDPELPEAYVSRGVALSQGGRSDEAPHFFETALRLDPKHFEGHYFFARHHFTAGEAEKAIEYYERAAALRPEDYQVPLLSAQIYDDLGRSEEGRAVRERGVRVAEEHLRLNPDDARALYIGANGLVSLGQLEKGLKWARLARELQPNEPMALYNLTCIYSLAGEVDEAIDCFTACLDNGFSYLDWAEHDSNLDAIRNDPRFVELMTRLR